MRRLTQFSSVYQEHYAFENRVNSYCEGNISQEKQALIISSCDALIQLYRMIYLLALDPKLETKLDEIGNVEADFLRNIENNRVFQVIEIILMDSSATTEQQEETKNNVMTLLEDDSVGKGPCGGLIVGRKKVFPCI